MTRFEKFNEVIFESYCKKSVSNAIKKERQKKAARGQLGQIVVLNLDTTSVTATNSFDGVRTGECRNITPDRHFGYIELMRQIVVCIVPSQAQHFQQALAAFG